MYEHFITPEGREEFERELGRKEFERQCQDTGSDPSFFDSLSKSIENQSSAELKLIASLTEHEAKVALALALEKNKQLFAQVERMLAECDAIDKEWWIGPTPGVTKRIRDAANRSESE